MDIKIKLNTCRAFRQPLEDGMSCLVAYWNHTRPDGAFSGLNLSIQASPRIGEHHPDSVDSELFFQTVALVNAAPQLLAACQAMVAAHHAGPITDEMMAAWNNARAAIAAATTHPLQDELEAAEIAYEESQEMARARAAERADRYADDDMDLVDPDPYLHSDIDPETLQGSADFARETANEDRLLGGAA